MNPTLPQSITEFLCKCKTGCHTSHKMKGQSCMEGFEGGVTEDDH